MTEQLKEIQGQNADMEMKCHLLRAFNFWKLFSAENKTKQKVCELRDIRYLMIFVLIYPQTCSIKAISRHVNININTKSSFTLTPFKNILKITPISRQLADLKKTIEISLRDKAKLIDSFEKEKFILKEQLSALRKSYAVLRNEHETVRKTLDREVCDLKF